MAVKHISRRIFQAIIIVGPHACFILVWHRPGSVPWIWILLIYNMIVQWYWSLSSQLIARPWLRAEAYAGPKATVFVCVCELNGSKLCTSDCGPGSDQNPQCVLTPGFRAVHLWLGHLRRMLMPHSPQPCDTDINTEISNQQCADQRSYSVLG